MKALLLVLLLGTSTVCLAADSLRSPSDAISQFGAISVSDGSSYYTFSKDGSFRSGPLGMSGRTMRGRWTTDADKRFVVTARLSWINGSSTDDQYRRIVFFISHVSKRASDFHPSFAPKTELFDSYFFIDEMTTVAKPPEDIPE